MAPPIRPTYTPDDLLPKRVGAQPASHLHRHDVWSTVPSTFDVNEWASAQAVASIRRAFLLAKTSHAGWQSYKTEGRFDTRRAAAATRLDLDVFKRKTGRSTTRVKCVVLLDASGSMNNADARVESPIDPTRKVTTTRRVAAAAFGATIAKALGAIPTVDLDVFQHTVGYHEGLILKWRWTRGTPVSVFNGATGSIGGSGNADGHALFALTQRMLKTLKKDERGVIMVVSDGLPSDYGKGGSSNAGQALIDAVAHARKNGITVIGVAIDGSDQRAYYGDGLVIHDGSWTHLGTALAKIIGTALAKRR